MDLPLTHEVPWSVFKSFVDARFLSIQWLEFNDTYWLNATDGPFFLECRLWKLADDQTEIQDFETNYKTKGNVSFSDIDGTLFSRQKISKKGWSFWALPIEITTSTLCGSLYAKDATGVDIPGLVCKIYDENNAEITTAGILNANLNTCVKTILDFEPAFDYEMIGGILRINNNASDDVRLWVIGAPDIPAIYGGSKEFASGVNLKFLAPDSAFEIDGRVTKYVTYNPNTHQGKLRVILKHDAGLQLNIQIIIHTYKQ